MSSTDIHVPTRMAMNEKTGHSVTVVNPPQSDVFPPWLPVGVPNDVQPWAIWSVRWTFDRFFYLAFLPSTRRYQGILRDLDMTPGTVPVETGQDKRGKSTFYLSIVNCTINCSSNILITKHVRL